MSSLRLFISKSHDPWFNLAVEDAIFQQMSPTQRVLFLWRNDNTVVIGRAQNPWKECNTRKMEEDGIKLARRSSGGGAVFQDLGNTCFTFMAAKPEYNKTVSTQIIIDALAKLGLNAVASGRNDLVIQTEQGEKKISGSAYKETMDRGFHHGTLLLSADMSKLANYLNPDPKKLKAKVITSVRSRVTNLNHYIADIDHAKVCDVITAAFFEHYGETVEAEFISPESMPDLPGFEAIFAKQSSWAWNFGHAPAFTHLLDERFTWGGVDIHVDVSKGVITDCLIYTDSLQPSALEALAQALKGCLYSAPAIGEVMTRVAKAFPDFQTELNELAQWLQSAVK